MSAIINRTQSVQTDVLRVGHCSKRRCPFRNNHLRRYFTVSRRSAPKSAKVRRACISSLKADAAAVVAEKFALLAEMLRMNLALIGDVQTVWLV